MNCVLISSLKTNLAPVHKRFEDMGVFAHCLLRQRVPILLYHLRAHIAGVAKWCCSAKSAVGATFAATFYGGFQADHPILVVRCQPT